MVGCIINPILTASVIMSKIFHQSLWYYPKLSSRFIKYISFKAKNTDIINI